MAAVKSHEASRFIASPPPGVFLYLLYGTDAGLVSERARKILSRATCGASGPFNLVRISGDELAEDPARLAEEANTVPLFGTRRAIAVTAQSKSFAAAIEPLLKAPPRDCTIVIEAGSLKKDAPLRSLCERAQGAAAIPCYPDSPQDIARLIDAEAAAEGLTVAPAAKAFLVSQLGEDRLATRSELEKLFLFAHGGKEITLEHVRAVCSNASGLIASDAVNAAFAGDYAGLDAALRHLFAGAGDYHAVLAAALRHALDLHRARLETAVGQGSSRGAPAFIAFKQRDAFESHLRGWTRPGLEQATGVLAATAAATRSEPKLGRSLTERALWEVARLARSKGESGKPGLT
ncbi:MAG TPA: DNA polymerase III subunit delta [Methylocella sp.]|nr:DNA polymerase III subunit delta [Methylocella sp.]